LNTGGRYNPPPIVGLPPGYDAPEARSRSYGKRGPAAKMIGLRGMFGTQRLFEHGTGRIQSRHPTVGPCDKHHQGAPLPENFPQAR